MENNSENGKKCCGMKLNWATIYWWVSLQVAVLAVPAVAIVIANLVPGNLGQALVFVLACWVSTFLGMKLMKK